MRPDTHSETVALCAPYSSAELKLQPMNILYLFRFKSIDRSTATAVVSNGSGILDSLSEGDVLEMTFYPDDRTLPGKNLPARVDSIRRDHPENRQGACTIGFAMIEE